MEYIHRENGHRMRFEDEKDFLRARLVYLETYRNASISFLDFIRERRYEGRPLMKQGRIEVRVEENDREVVTVPLFSNSERNANGNSYAEARIRREEQLQRLSMGHPYYSDRDQIHALRTRQMEELMRLHEMGYISTAPAIPANPALDDGNEFEVEYQSEYLGVDEQPPPRETIAEMMAAVQPIYEPLRAMGYMVEDKEEVQKEPEIEEIVEKKSIKKTTVFDIIDID